MRALKTALQTILAFSACMAASSCARMYDGTIVPEYTTEMVSNGAPHFETRKTDLLPPSRLVEFPETPEPPVSETKPVRVSAPRRQPARLLPKIDGDLPRTVRCRNEAVAEGRIKVICM